jgi:hypothetical protein
MPHSRPGIKLDADRAKLLLDDGAVDRIIARVGDTLPDRDALRYDLLICYGRYCKASGPGSPEFLRRQISRQNSIQKHAKRLVGLLKADDADFGITREQWSRSPEHPDYLLPQIVYLVEMIDKMSHDKPADIAKRTKTHLGTLGSALQWLTGTLLPEVYSKHFGKKATISRDFSSHAPGGRYMRFANQVLVELKIECSDETIASALHMVKSRKNNSKFPI